LKYFDLIFVRESLSLKEIKKDGAQNAICVPDLSFYISNDYDWSLCKKSGKKLYYLTFYYFFLQSKHH